MHFTNQLSSKIWDVYESKYAIILLIFFKDIFLWAHSLQVRQETLMERLQYVNWYLLDTSV